jgi:sugar/nucleoside kinase (ribokinase family)
VVVINQQVHRGLHTPHLRRRLAALIAAHPDKTFIVDSRHFRGEFPGACLKINEREACGESGIEIPLHTAAPDDVVRSAAETLHQRMRRPVFITRAARGMLVCDEHGLFDAPAVPLTGEIDPVGAGDATLAGVAAALAAGAEPRTAADFACLVAAVTVKKLRQCGTASPEEIRALLPSNSAGDETP